PESPLRGRSLADGARFLCASPPAALAVRPAFRARAAKSARSPSVSGPGAGLVDAVGTRHTPARRDARIVSLVPSITELVCDLGLAAQLVGRTGFCVHPREVVRRIPKVGGTNDVDLDKVRALRATHVILTVDENRKEHARSLAEFVPELIVTHPLAPIYNLALYRLIRRIFGRE